MYTGKKQVNKAPEIKSGLWSKPCAWPTSSVLIKRGKLNMQELASAKLMYKTPRGVGICDTWPWGTQQVTFWELQAARALWPLEEHCEEIYHPMQAENSDKHLSF